MLQIYFHKTQQTSPTSGPPTEESPSVIDKTVRTLNLKPTRWAAGLIGPLREVT